MSKLHQTQTSETSSKTSSLENQNAYLKETLLKIECERNALNEALRIVASGGKINPLTEARGGMPTAFREQAGPCMETMGCDNGDF